MRSGLSIVRSFCPSLFVFFRSSFCNTGEVEAAYLKAELTNDGASSGAAWRVGAAPARPVGVVLVPGQTEAKEGGVREGTLRGASGSSGASGSKRKGKPSWLKIN